jgi:uncharacterized protein Yka (UPF0111/DUF47 family)
MDEGRGERKGGVLSSIFPQKYDFQGMLQAQADETLAGVDALVIWLKRGDLSIAPDELQRIEEEADRKRHEMEGLLLEAFSTPFDRQDIYSISRQMDYVLNFCLSTAIEMRAFGVQRDEAIMAMAEDLQKSTAIVREAIRVMERDPSKADSMVKAMRRSEREIEIRYVTKMTEVFATEAPIDAMKKREVYHHLKDAGRTLSITIDILHRIIVGLA